MNLREILVNKYNAERDAIEALRATAATETRSLNEHETTELQTRSASAEALYKQIEELNKEDERNAKVAKLAAGVHSVSENIRSKEVYGPDTGNSYFADLYRAQKYGDSSAKSRLAENARAMSTGSDADLGAIFLPPKWLLNELIDTRDLSTPIANLMRTMPLPAPVAFKIPVIGDHAEVGVQAAENDEPVETEVTFNAEKTATPFTVTGKIVVSRQLAEAGGPGVDDLLKRELRNAYAELVESSAVTRLNAVTGFNAVAATEATWVAKLLDAQAAVLTNRKAQASVAVMSPNRYVAALKETDDNGRPLVVSNNYGPVNVVGIGTVNAVGTLQNMPVVLSAGVADNTVYVLKADDLMHWSSGAREFTFLEQLGPQSIVLAIWGYEAFFLGAYPNGISKMTIAA